MRPLLRVNLLGIVHQAHNASSVARPLPGERPVVLLVCSDDYADYTCSATVARDDTLVTCLACLTR